MPKKNVTVVKRVVAAAAAFGAVLALSASASAAAVSSFHRVAVVSGIHYFQSDGVRFVAATNQWGNEHGVVRVFDALHGRDFRLAAPTSPCRFESIGGGFALWSCYQPNRALLTNLSTGRSREPVGIEQVWQKATEGLPYCGPAPGYAVGGSAVGRYWVAFTCVSGWGYRDGTPVFYLNHRTGLLSKEYDPYALDVPFADLDGPRLFRPYCAGVHSTPYRFPPYFDYAPPFALQLTPGMGPRLGSILLRRCGDKRAEVLSRCPQTDCRSPQLGSEYVTWGEYKRVYAYLPRIRRRVLVGRAPADRRPGRKLAVAHTCYRIFARWGDSIYEARFEPERGAPPCQHRG